MLTPNFLLHIGEGAEAIANLLHNEILTAIVRRIMARLNHNDDYLLTATDRWQIETLQESGYLLEDIQKQISKRTGQELAEIQKAFKSAGINSLKYDDAIYKSAGLDPKPLNQSPHLIRVLERNFEQTAGTWENITRTTANAAQQQFIQTCDKALNLANSGGFTMQQAVMNAIDDLARNGVGYVDYPSGHRDTIEVATLRAVRTGVNQTAAQISLKRMSEMDWDIILVSSHLGARNTQVAGIPYADHESWQGKFYSRTGKDKRFPDFVSSTGYGTGEGLCGWNCRHSFGSGDGEHNNFKDFDTDENKKRYELEQEQRKKERKIREYKRRYEVYKEALKADPNNADIKKRVDATKKKCIDLNTDYRAFCKANDLRPLEDRLKTGSYLKEMPSKKTEIVDKATDVLPLWEKRKENDPVKPLIEDQYFDAPNGKRYIVDNIHNINNHDQHEIDVANMLADVFGGDVHLVPKVMEDQNISTADYIFRGDYFELKTINGTGKNTIFDKINKSKNQSNNFIIDISNIYNDVSMGLILENINKVFWSRYTKNIDTIMLIKDLEVLNIFARK